MSALSLIGWSDSLYPRVAKNWAIQKALLPAFVVAIYSTPVEEKVTVISFFDRWDTGSLNRKKAYLPVDLGPSLSLAHFGSVYPTSLFVLWDRDIMPKFKISANYQKIRLIKLQFIGFGFV